jgi:hypothetical protein
MRLGRIRVLDLRLELLDFADASCVRNKRVIVFFFRAPPFSRYFQIIAVSTLHFKSTIQTQACSIRFPSPYVRVNLRLQGS